MSGDRAECGSCGRPMNAAAAACPHCGARVDGQASSPPGGLAGVRLSADEARALLATEGRSPALDGAGPGLFGSLFLPHPMTSGRARVAEIGLTVVALPILMSSFFALGIMPRTYRSVRRHKPGEIKTPLLASAFGVPTFGWILTMAGVGGWSAFGIAGLLASALFVRAGVRQRAARGPDTSDLYSVPKREKPAPPPKLPPARAQQRPAKPAAASPASSAPDHTPAAPAPEAGEGPSFLK